MIILNNKIITADGKYEEYSPSYSLKRFIRKYYFLEGFSKYIGGELISLSKQYVEMVFHFEDSYIMLFDEEKRIFKCKKAYVIGFDRITKFHRTLLPNRLKVFVIEISYEGITSLMDINPIELCYSMFDLEEIYGYAGQNLSSNISNAQSNIQIIEKAEHFFERQLKRNHKLDTKSFNLFKIIDNNPQISMFNICNCLNVNRKTVERLYANAIGIAPKDFFKLVRFNNAYFLLSRYPKLSMCDIAYECGYSDQSHFINDFKLILGSSPLKYLQKEDIIYLGRGFCINKKNTK